MASEIALLLSKILKLDIKWQKYSATCGLLIAMLIYVPQYAGLFNANKIT